MSYSFRTITENDVQQFFLWQYAPPYDIYNLGGDPSSDDIAYYLDRQYQYHIMLDDDNMLLAFCSFGKDGQVPGGDYSKNALDIGMGVHPELTGQGKGIRYVQRVVDFAFHSFAPTALRVTIAEFNRRAQRVWQKAGFVEVSRFHSTAGNKPFVIYLHSANIFRIDSK